MGAIVVLRAGVHDRNICFCAAFGRGRGGARRDFFGEIARKSRKFQQKTEFSAGIGRKRAAGGWVAAQRYGKLRVRLSFCAQVCAAAVAFALQLGAAGRYAEMREIAGAAVGLYVGGHGRCFCF